MAAAQTRLQAKGSPYRGSADVVRHIVREQGAQGLWVGSTPSMVRGRSTDAGAVQWVMTAISMVYVCKRSTHTWMTAVQRR